MSSWLTWHEAPRYLIHKDRSPFRIKTKREMLQSMDVKRSRPGIELRPAPDGKYAVKKLGHLKRVTPDQIWASMYKGDSVFDHED